MYYTLNSDKMLMTAYIEEQDAPQQDLVGGRPIDPKLEPGPFRYTVRDPHKRPLFDFYAGPCLMSKRLVRELKKCGVNNLQTFEAEI